MEGWLSFCFVVLCTLMAVWLLKLSGGKSKAAKPRLPPGPWNLPIIGSLHHIVSALPHRKITELSRRHGPLMLLRLGEIPTVVVSSAEAAALVLKTNDPAFADRSSSVTMEILGCGGKGIVLAPYGDWWRQMRKVCIVELLSSKQVKRMEGIRAKEVGNLIRSIAAATPTSETINISQKVTALSNDVVSRAVFGGKFTRQKEYLREIDEALALVAGFCLVDLFPSSRLVRWLTNAERDTKRSYNRIQSIVIDIMEGRKAAQASGDRTRCIDDEDLLDVLLRLQEDDSLAFPITTDIIGAVLIDIFTAGTETTGSVLEWAMSELVCHPEAMAKAQLEVRTVLGEGRSIITNNDLAELHYMRMVIKEVLRLHPPIPLVPRKCREDSKIMGYDMLEGTNVYVNIFAVSRDPKYWENPEEFNPERFENNMDYNGTYPDFTPFGAGRRQCPGIQFSSSLMELTLANFLYHFDWMLPDGASQAMFDMSEKFTFTVGRRYNLQVRAIPHVCFKAILSQ
ncbi:hypothetical protein ACQJBY_056145 [Aegilops geniculata]